MKHLSYITKSTIKELTFSRKGETKIGDKVSLASGDFKKWLSKAKAEFILIGIPESIGVRANYGKPGCEKMWNEFIGKFLNVQQNGFLDGKKIGIAGIIDVADLNYQSEKTKLKGEEKINLLRKLTSEIDLRVISVIKEIVHQGKTPIVIGGGHNNSYGNIAAVSQAMKKKISVINIDAHADLRKKEGRHSGNGFTYALSDGFLNKYYAIGLHENYNSEYLLEQFRKNKNLGFSTFDSYLRGELSLDKMTENAIRFVGKESCGLEIDMDSISGFPSSAETESGFTADEVRKMIMKITSSKKPVYLHITEGSPSKVSLITDRFSKLVATFVTDYIKAKTVR